MLFAIAIVFASCSTRQPVVRTTKPMPTKKPVAITKPVTTKKPETTQQNNPSNQNSEILEATTRVKVTTAMVLEYIAQYKETAKGNMKQYGIPSSIILGQGILESGAGTGPLSTLANNHFGIKCHKEWTGPSVRYDDDEAQECFRKYEKAAESYKDHSLFLTGRPRYSGLFELDKGDYKKWAKGLKDAGYATDPKYPEKLIGIIERYQLDQYDAEVLGTPFVPINTKEQLSVNSSVYQVSQGDTLYSISKKFNITVDDLKKKNSIQDNAISIGQNLIIK